MAAMALTNGEIYNYRALRSELEQHGVSFRTEGDTETLLGKLFTWVKGGLDRLEGMYAFCFVDLARNAAIAARDPLGIKPSRRCGAAG